MKIKRTKTGEGGPLGTASTTAIHYAMRVDAISGAVTDWTTLVSQACDLDAAVIQLVRQHYLERPNAGRLDFVGAQFPAPLEERVSTEESLRVAQAEIGRLSDENRRLVRELEAATSLLASTPAPVPPYVAHREATPTPGVTSSTPLSPTPPPSVFANQPAGRVVGAESAPVKPEQPRPGRTSTGGRKTSEES